MPNRYCLLCGNRDKSASYYSLPKNKESRQKWLAFCGIDEQVLNTATKLCWNHFQKDDIICLAKGSVVKHNAVPSIMKKNVHKRSDFKNTNFNTANFNTADFNTADFNTADFNTADFNTPNFNNANFNNRSAPTGNFEFVSVNENAPVLLEETGAAVDRLSIPPSCESVQSFETPVTPVRNLRYFGDIKTEHFATPTTATIALELAKRTIAKQRTKIKSLQQTRNRMLRRLTTMKTQLKLFKKKSRMCEMTASNLMQKSKR